MDIRMKRLCLILIILGLSSCSSKEEGDANFTGIFELIYGSGPGVGGTMTFKLVQHKTRIEGEFHSSARMGNSFWWETYYVIGSVPFPDADTAELVLTLTNASYPSDSTPETIHAILKNHGKSLYVSEWEKDVPRVKVK